MKIRVAKYLANRGAASRRYAEKMILEGRVMLNGKVVDTPITFVTDGDEVKADGKIIPVGNGNPNPEVYIFHKPIGCITSARDPAGRRVVYDLLPKKYRHLIYVGRLDYNTSGLLLLTNSGDFARRMTLPTSGIERVYIARLGRALTLTDEVVNQMIDPARHGIKIDGIIYRPMKIERIPERADDFKITVAEGKKNEIRIVFEHIGLPVRRLHRIAYGKYELGTLPPGRIKKSKAQV